MPLRSKHLLSLRLKILACDERLQLNRHLLQLACPLHAPLIHRDVLIDQERQKGKLPEIYIALKPGVAASKAIEQAVVKAIEVEIGKIARPRHVWIVPDMPKTRSGKIMRRVLAAISNGSPVGDITTLANPEVVEQVRKMVQGK